MIKRFGGNLAPLIGLCIAALVAATLASYVVVGQRFGIAPQTAVPDGGPLVLERPEVPEPLILAGEPPQTAPEAPTITTVASAPSTPSDTIEPGSSPDNETFSGGLATDFSPTLTERVFGVIDSVTFQAGTIKASVEPDKSDNKKDKKDKDEDEDEDKDEDEDEDEGGEPTDDGDAPDEAVADGSNSGDDSVGDDEADDALPGDDGDDDADDSDEDEAVATGSESKDKDKAPKGKKDKEPKEPKEPKDKKDKKDKGDDDKGKP